MNTDKKALARQSVPRFERAEIRNRRRNRRKAEYRNPNLACVGGLLAGQSECFGLRVSDFLRISAFGFRIWRAATRS